MYWNQRKNTLSLPLSTGTNVANIHMAPGYTNYAQYCQQAEVTDNATSDKCIIISHTAEIEVNNSNKSSKGTIQKSGSDNSKWKVNPDHPQSCDFDLNGPTTLQSCTRSRPT